VSTVITVVLVIAAFHALGVGPALVLRSWTALPWRFLALLSLLATSILSYGVFWISFAVPWLRLPLVGGVTCASVAVGAVAWYRARRGVEHRGGGGPALAATVGAAIYVTPLLLGGPAVNDRFTWKLPSDNILPGLFAHRVVVGDSTVRPVPPLWPGGDRASERPPLQAAVVVTVGSMVPGLGGDEYQILATLCQLQWLPALWLIGVACGFPRRTLAFVLLACALSGFFFVNSIYTWPKLFAASLMLGGLAIALEPSRTDPGAARARALVVSTLCALSLLAHPGPVFTLIALPVMWPVLRPILTIRRSAATLVTAGLVVVTLSAPWLAYQTFIDPPSGRLIREHLGDGQPQGSVLTSIARANVERPLAEHVRIRIANLVSQVGNPFVDIWPGSVARGQQEQFFHHGAALGVLLIGLVMALGPPRAGTPDDAVRRLVLVALVSLALWSLLVFAPGDALVHHGSPVTTALLFFGGAYGLTRLRPVASWSLLGLHAAVCLYLWILPVWRGPWLTG
jgi:hypothetical protein